MPELDAPNKKNVRTKIFSIIIGAVALIFLGSIGMEVNYFSKKYSLHERHLASFPQPQLKSNNIPSEKDYSQLKQEIKETMYSDCNYFESKYDSKYHWVNLKKLSQESLKTLLIDTGCWEYTYDSEDDFESFSSEVDCDALRSIKSIAEFQKILVGESIYGVFPPKDGNIRKFLESNLFSVELLNDQIENTVYGSDCNCPDFGGEYGRVKLEKLSKQSLETLFLADCSIVLMRGNKRKCDGLKVDTIKGVKEYFNKEYSQNNINSFGLFLADYYKYKIKHEYSTNILYKFDDKCKCVMEGDRKIFTFDQIDQEIEKSVFGETLADLFDPQRQEKLRLKKEQKAREEKERKQREEEERIKEETRKEEIARKEAEKKRKEEKERKKQEKEQQAADRQRKSQEAWLKRHGRSQATVSTSNKKNNKQKTKIKKIVSL